MNTKPFVIILTGDADGPVYLGSLDAGPQGVRNIGNARRYTTRGRAWRIAAAYDGTVAHVGPVDSYRVIYLWAGQRHEHTLRFESRQRAETFVDDLRRAGWNTWVEAVQ